MDPCAIRPALPAEFRSLGSSLYRKATRLGGWKRGSAGKFYRPLLPQGVVRG